MPHRMSNATQQDAMDEYIATGWLPDGSDTAKPMDTLMEHEEGMIACDLLRAYRNGNYKLGAITAWKLGSMLDDIVTDLIKEEYPDED